MKFIYSNILTVQNLFRHIVFILALLNVLFKLLAKLIGSFTLFYCLINCLSLKLFLKIWVKKKIKKKTSELFFHKSPVVSGRAFQQALPYGTQSCFGLLITTKRYMYPLSFLIMPQVPPCKKPKLTCRLKSLLLFLKK